MGLKITIIPKRKVACITNRKQMGGKDLKVQELQQQDLFLKTNLQFSVISAQGGGIIPETVRMSIQ